MKAVLHKAAVRRFSGLVVAMFLSMAAVVPAFAQTDPTITVPTFDTAPVIQLLVNVSGFIVTVGMQVLLLMMVVKGLKWVRRAG